MKAAVLRQFGQALSIEDIEIGRPGPQEVLVRTAAVGLCHSDLHYIEGMRPFDLPGVLGHEVSGIVEAVGEGVRDLRPGDHVVCMSNGGFGGVHQRLLEALSQA